MNKNKTSKPETIFRSIGRASSIAVMLLISAFLFGGGESLAPLKMHEILGLSLFPGGVILGFLIAWQFEIPGGCVSVLSLMGFYAWHYNNTGHINVGPYFIFLTAPAIFFLLAGCFSSSKQTSTNKPKLSYDPSTASNMDRTDGRS